MKPTPEKVSERAAHPADWQSALDREPAPRDGIAICTRYGISMSGSTWEKKRRAVVAFDFAIYVLGGGVDNDENAVGSYTGQIAELTARRDACRRRGDQTPDLDATILSVERDVETLRQRIAAAGDHSDNQIARRAEAQAAEQVLNDLRDAEARFIAARAPLPPELDAQLDAAVLRDEKAADRFAAGRVELDRINASMAKAEAEGQHGLGTTLRQRVLPLIAEPVREAMHGKVALHQRRPEKGLPPEVNAALRAAEQVCAVADRLTGETTALHYFAALLGDGLRAVVFPPERALGITMRREPLARMLETTF